jgi:N-acetylglucosamine-6-phosphate deacetylase
MNATLRRARGTLAASLGLLGLTLLALAQPPGPSPLSPPANGPRHADSTWHAFTHATVHVNPEKTLEDATVVIKDGRIVSVGGDAPPAGARVWDCMGQHIYAGFIDAYVEADAPKPDRNTPGVHWSAKVTPQRSALDGTGLDDKSAESLRKLGFAAAAIAPKGGVFRGSGAVVSLAKPSSESSADRPPVYRKDAYQSVAFELRTEGGRRRGGEDTAPDSEHWSAYPDSEMGAIALIRQTLIDADWQADARKAGANIAPNALDALESVSRAVLGPGRATGGLDSKAVLPTKGPGWDFSNNDVHVLDGSGAVDMPGPALATGSTRDPSPIPTNPGVDTAKMPTLVDRNAPAVRAATAAHATDQQLTLTMWSAPTAAAPAPNDGPHYTVLLFSTEDELEALRAAKIAREFSRPAALLGSGTEFRRLDAIKADGLPIVLPLNYPKTPDVSSIGKAESVELRDLMTWEQAPTNPRRLDAAGLKIALTTAKLRNRADFEDNLRSALRCGLPPSHALAMLTTQPAEILGVSDRLGSIEPGKQANLVIADSDLFEAWPRKQGSETATQRNSETGKGEEAKEPEKKPEAAAQPDEGEHGDRPGRGPGGDRPERPKSKIREVWIDGVRHEIVPPAAKDVYGTWKVIEIDGKPIDEEGDAAVVFMVTKEGDVTYRRGGNTEKAGNVRISESRLEYTLDAKRIFDIPAVLTDSGVVDEPDLMHGITPMPNGNLRRWSAKRTSHEVAPVSRAVSGPGSKRPNTKGDQAEPGASATQRARKAVDEQEPGPETARLTQKEGAPKEGDREPRKDADQEEREAIASIPETYGYPFGPYMLAQRPPQEFLALTHATIWTSGPDGILENASLLIAGGKIVGIGTGVDFGTTTQGGKSPRVIDCTGKHITPGIVDCHSHTGISKGVNEGGQAVTAEVRIQDVTDPDSVSWYRQLAAGVTCVNSLHGSANAIGGQNCINKNRWGVKHPDEMHLEGAMPGIKFALGENPKQSNWGDRQVTRYPQTRMGVETLIRDRFTAARDYMQEWSNWPNKHGGNVDVLGDLHFAEVDGGAPGWREVEETLAHAPAETREKLFAEIGPPPRRDLELEALAEVLEGKRLVHCHSYRQDELLMLCRIADDFGFKIGTFQHVLEGYKVADEIARHSRGGSTFSDWWAYKVEVQDAIPQNGPIMASQGVVVSYNSDSDELARRLNTEAAKAVKYGGMKPDEALKFVTINSAIQLAIQDRVGSLEPGKDADFVIWSGPPMSTFSRPEATYVDGRCLFSLEQDKAHRETIQKERARLIQKALAAAKRKPPERAGQTPGERGIEGPWYRPTDDATTDMGEHRRTGILERYYLDLLNRGGDPSAARPGECGCGAQN